MKRAILLILPVLFLLTGCLILRTTEYRISFNDNFSRGKIKIIFHNIRSDEMPDRSKTDSVAVKGLIKKREDDFRSLLEMTEDDASLLDALEMGIYLKKRYLFEKNNQLNGAWEGIFKNLNFGEDDGRLNIAENDIVLTFKKDSDTKRIETDGHLTENKTRVIITWPKTMHNIYWKTISKEESGESVSLLKNYKKWKRNRNK